ncbi:predicted protein [Sclerotinia sclerotiorum 1980 UF-70]|uniref:Uncharacterized protein n=1 Tax=Sclerotinia sclerotiorum (strain ATCC 18683 / 1980 / Ss-1) TaxID=665079 RepID=A7EHD6_SCLS1|nr:predicted protein [Sclerotinia sclerotiorum 1980 UF-70]EDO02252.1 predicted protein [Sclerotinia sclerotiorum 1980 UF-70]
MTIFKPFEGDTLEEFNAHHIEKKDFLLCHNCGWNAENQQCDSYKVIVREVVEYLTQLRKFTSEKIEAPDGSPIRDRILNNEKRIEFVTDDAEKWWASVEPHLENKWDGKRVSGQWKESLKSRYPVKGPWTCYRYYRLGTWGVSSGMVGARPNSSNRTGRLGVSPSNGNE